MGETTIEWTATRNGDGTLSPGYTFNPWIGCTKVSDGCKHCYAETLMDKRYGRVKWGPQGKRVRTSVGNWRNPLRWNKQAQAEGRRYRVFCASLADVFEDKPDQPELDEWRRDLISMIYHTPNLDWLLLTKRPENVNQMIYDITGTTDIAGFVPNVWIGTSVENQEQADKRIPELLKIPAAVRFLSCEPLLGAIDLWGARYPNPNGGLTGAVTTWPGGVNWVIVGGESGPGARPMNIKWVYDIRDQCIAAGTPFFFKQHGEWIAYTQIAEWKPNTSLMEHYGMTADEATGWVIKPEWKEAVYGNDKWGVVQYNGRFLPQTTTWNRRQLAEEDEWEHSIYRVGKHTAGRLLDGRTWDEFPVMAEEVRP